MKRLSTMASIAFATAVINTSCNSSTANHSNDSATQATKENEAKFDDKKLQNDADFMVEATAFSLEQIKLNAQGIRKGSKAPKGLSDYLMKQHYETLNAAKKLAEVKQISIPDTASVDAFNAQKTLEPKSGNEYDKAYVEKMVESYKKVIAAYEKEASDSREQDLKEWAKTQLPKLRSQLDTIFSVQRKLPQ